MINDLFSPEEQAIIQQIQAIPHLEISASAREAIRGRMLDEFRVVSQQAAAKAAPQTRLIFLAVTGLIVITIIVVIILAIISSQNSAPQTAPSTAHSETPQAITAVLTIPSPVVITPTEALASESSTVAANAELTTPMIDSALTITPSVTVISEAPLSTSATTNAIIVIEGPVINIANNVITIYDFDIEIEMNHPILYLIEIGDLVRIEGAYGSDGKVVASMVSNLSDMTLVNGATVSLDGPVESVNGNIIVVNGIPVQLEANDPLLQSVQVGQFVSVQGNFQGSGANIVLIVVTVIVNTDITVIENDCWYHESGMSGMGHWHCDNSGMGNSGMGNGGMGMGMGMGMGN